MQRQYPIGLAGLLCLTLALAGCAGLDGPRLLNESNIPTAAVLPSVTPMPTETATPTYAPPTPDFVAETRIALVTPTLPPSRTPVPTWTPSVTSSPIPLPTLALTLTPFPSATPYPTVAPILQQPAVQQPAFATLAQPMPNSAPPAAVDASGACVYPWFFSSRATGGCPAGAAVSTAAASLAFERGIMLWTGHDGMITVLYSDGQQPAWERYADTWMEGMPERDPAIIGPQGLWQQPRRGFGQVWRTTPTVRNRLGWALREWEDAYTATFQQTGNQGGGAIYVTGHDGNAYMLVGDQTRWERFSP